MGVGSGILLVFAAQAGAIRVDGLEAVADEPPWVRTRPLGPSGFEFSWFFRVSGRGLLIRAVLPKLGFEAGWRAVDEIVRSASVKEL